MCDKSSESTETSDQVDVRFLNYFKKKNMDQKDSKQVLDEKKVIDIPQIDPKESDSYGMNNFKRGKALVFNHYEFEDIQLSCRKGSNDDCANVFVSLEQLRFDVVVYNDLTYGKIYDILQEVSNDDHTGNDCLVIVVMTHGNSKILHAYDTRYSPDNLWMPFAGDKCKTLAGKPKLVFIQASDGKKELISRTETDSIGHKSQVTFKIPNMADFLVMYSKAQVTENGSIFINALCEELKTRYKTQDILSILTFVNRNLSKQTKSGEAKPVVSLVSSLTRLVYFYENNKAKRF